MNLSKAAYLSGCGKIAFISYQRNVCVLCAIKLFSQSIFLLSSLKSSFNCSEFPIDGVGVNFNPLFSKVFAVSLNFMLDKFIIFMSVWSLYLSWRVGVLNPEPCPDPDPGLYPGRDPELGPDLTKMFSTFEGWHLKVLWPFFVIPRFLLWSPSSTFLCWCGCISRYLSSNKRNVSVRFSP